MFFQVIFLLCIFLYFDSAIAGSFFGYEADDNEQSLLFAGSQTEQKTYFGVFIGDLKYEFLDNGVNTKVRSQFVTPTIGYRTGSDVSYSIAAGYTWESKQEQGLQSTDSNPHGFFAQLSASRWQPGTTHEFLLSYSSASEFVWSRYRGKHRLVSRWFLGGEVFWMGNEDFDSRGLGALFELSGKDFSTSFKIGAKTTSTDSEALYAGLEFYIPH